MLVYAFTQSLRTMYACTYVGANPAGYLGSVYSQYLRLAAALGARTSGAAAGDGVTAAAATAAAAAADGAAAPSQLHGMAGNLYPVFVTEC